jgi:hypothetical protein
VSRRAVCFLTVSRLPGGTVTAHGKACENRFTRCDAGCLLNSAGTMQAGTAAHTLVRPARSWAETSIGVPEGTPAGRFSGMQTLARCVQSRLLVGLARQAVVGPSPKSLLGLGECASSSLGR